MRDVALDLAREIYILCSDDSTAFTKNMKALRPIQLKEVKDMLDDTVKTKTGTLV